MLENSNEIIQALFYILYLFSYMWLKKFSKLKMSVDVLKVGISQGTGEWTLLLFQLKQCLTQVEFIL